MNPTKTEQQASSPTGEASSLSCSLSRKRSSMGSVLALAGLLLALPAVAPSLEPAPEQPQDLFVAPHQPVKLDCKIPPQLAPTEGRFFYWGFQRVTGADKPRMLCYESKCMADGSLGIQLQHEAHSGTYDLLIHNATYEAHNGLYYCDYQNQPTNQSVDRRFRLTVLIPPQPPSIVEPQTASEGKEFKLSCVSEDANPEPVVSWFRNDKPIAQDPSYRSLQTRANRTTTSSLVWLPTVADHHAIYRCAVWNRAMEAGASLEAKHQLQVEYAPRIQVGPSKPLKVLQGQSATLTCSVNANPPVQTVEWHRDNKFASHFYNYTISDVQESAVYTCRASNGIAPLALGKQQEHTSSLLSFFVGQGERDDTFVEAQLPVQVLYAPRVSIRSSSNSLDLKTQPINSGDSFWLNCSVDSSPPAHEFVWTKLEDPSFRVSQQTPLLEFENVTSKQMGTYTCTAYNKLEPSAESAEIKEGSASLAIYVKHKPGQAEIELGQEGAAELNAKTTIQCRANPPGFPEPHWLIYREAPKRKLLSKMAPNGTLTIQQTGYEHESKYSCQAENVVGKSSEASGQLIVNELTNLAPDVKLEDTRYLDEERYIINLRTLGKPEPKVTWFHRSPVDGRRRELLSTEIGSRFRIETESNPIETPGYNLIKPRIQTVTLLKFMQPLALDDRGLYSAEFNNGISKPKVVDFKLDIYHSPPIPVVGSEILLVKQSGQEVRTKAGFDPGESVRLTCRMSAHPQPRFNWYFTSPSLTEIVGASVQPRYQHSTRNVRDDIWESTVTFDNASESDLGDYLCVSANPKNAQNDLSDSVRMLVSLVRKSAPDAPTQLEAIDASQDSVTLQWFPGFDGGYPNVQYQVQYAVDDGSGLSLAKRMEAESEADARSALHSLECPSNPCVVGQLQPRQSYLFRVQAKNAAGESGFGDECSAATRANVSQIPKILEASFDAARNILHFRVEPGADLLAASLDAHVELKQSESADGEPAEWRHQTTVPMRHERAEAYLNVQPAADQLRLTLCSRLNKSLCGPEYVVSMRSATSSFLHEQRGLNLSVVVSSALLVVLVGGLATTLHTCCLSAGNNKAAAIERVDAGSLLDNKPTSGDKAGSTGSTASTSAGEHANPLANRLQSMDSLMMSAAGHATHLGHVNHAAGSASDHSSDHSRQAKLDSMLPPNYNHYADRASILQEQQHQQYLHSAYAHAATGSLLGVAGQQAGAFGYAPAGFSAEPQPQPLSLDHHLFASGLAEPPDGQQSLWPVADDYTTSSNNYSNSALVSGLAYQQPEAQALEPAYGSIMQQQQSAIYDNSANSGHFQAYLSACDEQQRASSRSAGSSYQQEIAAAQQQMYGTLSRPLNANNAADIIKSTITNQDAGQLDQQPHYNGVAANGLAHSAQQMESDYGTVGGAGSGRSARLIREIIV